ncbi:MAG: serine esterase [Cyanobacteria bacterium QH_8_48_120]|nr:MAG: serine esterase [Cyanobacteria bacterium QH_1_48_107]PSO57734.1 MAG: serine esterase [Cyanobacteria bacterium QH_10_48_56]PSO59567.1 MAG: serine esterase [Cyanobacteria bacterium QH_2_48_84]PSO61637.1 MAG: serine esterase [Cyanobacteria bacterium QH_7_48_89]PSO66898.1 MAG: serine esterase [Cyanobacteria bacterium QH_6_48_35]PSO69641.1 MAG: serine esterase [Cyanobacteria bacterium QH_3_48_40]PSO72393.1 MAG: serine esterase [Cyanobacteria bacterium QS_1_48_34]PSO73018.1 MAG: serine est
MALEAISVPPATGNPPNQLFVALHGWGSNAQDLASLAPMLNLGNCQMVFPHAPFPHPHVPGGKMWYNLEQWDEQGLAESRQRLTEWLQSLESSTEIPLSRTILSGFSQGGAMTLDVGLNFPLAGLCSLSGYLHGQPQAGQTFPPVLIVHGRQDSIVPLKAAQQARDALTSLGVAVEYQEFDMQHEVQPAVLDLMQRFITTKM